jgi:hypothetical protein
MAVLATKVFYSTPENIDLPHEHMDLLQMKMTSN